MDAMDLFELSASQRTLLLRGRGQPAKETGPCRDESRCKTCGAYNKHPWNCTRTALARVDRVFVLYAYGLKYHLGGRHKPDCPLMPLTVGASVETYAQQLMTRYGLKAGEFVVAQYRTGMAWHYHTEKERCQWACYGVRTIGANLARLRLQAGPGHWPDQLFLLTNAFNLHSPHVPVPSRCSPRCASPHLRTLLLNPRSSFHQTVLRLRGHSTGVHYIHERDTLKNDPCGCSAADEGNSARSRPRTSTATTRRSPAILPCTRWEGTSPIP